MTPCVFLHGFLGSSADWAEVIRRLDCHCIALDLPGHGKAPLIPFPTTPVHLIGYSMGGRLALQFAARYPERVVSLHLVSAHLGLKSQKERAERLKRDRELARDIRTMPIDEFLRRWYDQPLFKTLLCKMDIRTMRREQNREGLARALETFSLGRQEVCELHPRTKLFVGELDPVYREHYRDLPHTVIQGAGHAIHLEQPEALADALRKELL